MNTFPIKHDSETWAEYESRVNSYYEDAEDYGDMMYNMDKDENL